MCTWLLFSNVSDVPVRMTMHMKYVFIECDCCFLIMLHVATKKYVFGGPVLHLSPGYIGSQKRASCPAYPAPTARKFYLSKGCYLFLDHSSAARSLQQVVSTANVTALWHLVKDQPVAY